MSEDKKIKKETEGKQSGVSTPLPAMRPMVAGIDIGSKERADDLPRATASGTLRDHAAEQRSIVLGDHGGVNIGFALRRERTANSISASASLVRRRRS